jgi:autotransporter-associated beta strand protein
VGFDDTAGTSGTLELDGTPGTQGVLQTTELTKIGGTATVNFDGGILRASANNSNFISGFDAGDVTIQAGGLFLDTNGFSVTAKSGLGGAGTLTKQGAGSLFLTGTNTYTGDTTVEAGTLSLGAGGTTGSILGNVAVDNNARLAFFRSNDVVFDGVISGGGGVVQTGTGTTTLTGISTYTGPTEVAAGTLVVGDSANPTAVITSDTTVDNGATLAGYGTVASIDNNGRVMGGDPGGSLGVLSATGNYTQGAGGALVTYVTQPTTSQVQVSGTAHLSGAAVFNYQPGAYVPAIYPILTSGGGVSGDFDAFAEAGAIPLNLVRSLQYTSGTVNLILSLPTQADTGDDNSIFIDTSGTAQRNTQQATSFLLDDVAAKCKVTDQTCFWFNPLGHFASFDGHGDANSFTSDTGGFMAGGHRLVDDNLTLGVGAGYEYTGIATGDSSANVDTARVFAYGNLDLAPVELSGAIGYAHDWFDTDRANADGLLGVDSANESHQASEYSAGLQLAVPTSIGSVNLRPKIGLQYAYIDESSFDESGAPPLNLHGDSYNHSSLRSFVGLGVSRPFAIDDLILTPSLNLGYARELLSDAQAARLSIDGLPTFRPDNPVTTRNIVTAGIGVDLSNFHGVNFTANYDANIYVGDGVDHTVRLQGRWTF